MTCNRFLVFGQFLVPRIMSHSTELSSRTVPETAGIIVIGDEILKGYTADTNSHYLSKRLFQLGIKVARISVIPDQVDIIADEVKLFSERYTHVFTSGGVGPTHDDKTFLGVAKAFDQDAVLNPDLGTLLKAYFNLKDTDDEHSASQLRMAVIPKNAELMWGVNPQNGRRSLYPVVCVKNVLVLPGIPSLLQRAFSQLEHKFAKTGSRFFFEKIFLNSDEFAIADTLTSIADKYAAAGVNVGSYPKIGHSYYRVKVTVDSASMEETQSACEELKERLQGKIVNYDSDPLANCEEKFRVFCDGLRSSDPDFATHIATSVALIDEQLRSLKSPEIALSFNGGKDCTVILHLLYLTLLRIRKEKPIQITAVYIRNKNPFQEMEAFISESQKRYGFNLIRLDGDIKSSLYKLKESHPEIRAIFMGTRHSDMGGRHIDPVSPTDPGWPEFLRVSPLLGWNYAQIWKFLRGLWLPYCPLYDRGYTSLGAKDDTLQNEALKYRDNFNLVRYNPAFMLSDESLERTARS